MRLDCLESDRLEIVDRKAEAVRLGNGRRARLEFMRQLAPGGLVDADGIDHVSAEQERFHRAQQLTASPERSDAAWRAHLVSRERDEVGADCLHVDLHVRRRLGRVADEDRALLVRPGDERREIVDGAERVRDKIRGDDLHRVVPRDLVEVREVRIAVLVDPQHQEFGPLPLSDVLPGHEVRMVLELGHDDSVSGAEVVSAPRVCHEVQALRRIAEEDHLASVRGIEERARLLSRALEAAGRALGQHVDRAVDVRVRCLVELSHPVEHLARLLRGVRGVEVGKTLAVDLLLEDREVAAQRARVELGSGCHSHDFIVTTGTSQRSLRDFSLP